MNLHSSSLANRARGFSLIELILVLVLLGIIAAIAVPRFAGTGSAFQQAAFEQQLISAVRYAQQTAVAQNRSVEVVLASNGFTIRFHDDDSVFLRNPADGKPFNNQEGNPGQAPGNLTLSASETFRFDGLGRPLQDNDLLDDPLNFSINGTNLRLEPQTGYFYVL